MPSGAPKSETVHGTCVATSPDSGVLIVGASKSGKSSLALLMMGFGAQLVSDDQTRLQYDEQSSAIHASAPNAIKGMIEARGVGLLKAQALDRCKLRAVVDLDLPESERLPPRRIRRLLGCDLPLIHQGSGPVFAAALMQLLKEGRIA
ncbi:HPr kinase/phosphorylase [Pacificibacter maritimus]|nr:serine kinase [Pacificibacter maritimus]